MSALAGVLSEADLAPAVYLRTATALADAALVVDESHDDPAVLLGAADQLERGGGGRPARAATAVLAKLLRARAALGALQDAQRGGSDAEFASAVAELRQATETTGD